MRLQRVTFLGVPGLADASFDFTDPLTGEPHDLVVLTGASASGKTRALEAIVAAKEAVAPYGPMIPGAAWAAAGGRAAKIALSWWLGDEERAFAGTASPVAETEALFEPGRVRVDAEEGVTALLGRYAHAPQVGRVDYFPANRRMATHGPFGGTSLLEQRLARPGKDGRKYAFVQRFLRDLPSDATAEAAFAARLASLSDTCRYERDRASSGLPRCLTSRGRPPTHPGELSDAEQDAVLFAATAVATELGSSVVLVDRPELFVDPARVPAWIEGLRALGPDNQLLLSSSSAEVLSAAGPARVARLEAVTP